MKNQRLLPSLFIVAAACMLGSAASAESMATSPAMSTSATPESEKNPHRGWIFTSEQEPDNTGWALYVDNDLLALRNSDKDYTGGISLTISGARARRYAWSLDPVLSKIDNWSGVAELKTKGQRQLHSMEMGFTVFTPESLTEPSKQIGDRPYASLLFLSNTSESIDLQNDRVYLSTFSLGVLGSKLISETQTALHKVLGSDKPIGWDNQISNGGEPTFRYSMAVQDLYSFNYFGDKASEITTTLSASVGYISQLSFGMAARVGQFNSPWYSFRPQLNNYSEKSTALVGLPNHDEEYYVWGGFNINLRAYNAFLQGQFKNSPVTYSHHELKPIVAEAWLGITRQFKSGWRLSYLLRGQSSEVKVGKANRSAIWGGLILSRSW